MTDFLVRTGKSGHNTDTQEKCHVETKTEIGVIDLQAKEFLGLLAITRS